MAMLFGIYEVTGHISTSTLMLQRIRQMRLGSTCSDQGQWWALKPQVITGVVRQLDLSSSGKNRN